MIPRTLDEWRELDRRFKDRCASLLNRAPPGVPPKGGDWWLTRQATLALAPAFLLTPVVTWILYPWLPQPEWWLYEGAGAMLLFVAYVAHSEYRKAQDEADADACDIELGERN